MANEVDNSRILNRVPYWTCLAAFKRCQPDLPAKNTQTPRFSSAASIAIVFMAYSRPKLKTVERAGVWHTALLWRLWAHLRRQGILQHSSHERVCSRALGSIISKVRHFSKMAIRYKHVTYTLGDVTIDKVCVLFVIVYATAIYRILAEISYEYTLGMVMHIIDYFLFQVDTQVVLWVLPATANYGLSNTPNGSASRSTRLVLVLVLERGSGYLVLVNGAWIIYPYSFRTVS